MVHSYVRAVEILAGHFTLALFLMWVSIFLTGCGRAAPPGPMSSPSAISAGTALPPDIIRDELLQRPLRLPKLNPDALCPRAIGSSPVYAAGFGVDGILYFDQPILTGSRFYGSAWSGNKVLWIVAPAYRGPVLIRGGRLDGPGALRFNLGLDPPSWLWMDPVRITFQRIGAMNLPLRLSRRLAVTRARWMDRTSARRLFLRPGWGNESHQSTSAMTQEK